VVEPVLSFGSPVPDTPIHTRRKREYVSEKLRDEHANGSNHNSFHNGGSQLHQQFIPPSSSQNNNKNNDENNNHHPHNIVHDGPHAEQELHTKYQLLEVLGVGSTSTVHRCCLQSAASNDSQAQAALQYYACKIIDCQLIEERFQNMMGQFQTEILALQELRHDHIVRLLDVYLVEGDKIYIIMELMEGGELFDYVVEKGTLTEEEASKIVRQVTSAIAFMHSRNFIHRDLKPENLLLKQRPKSAKEEIEVKIIDFGLSKVRSLYWGASR
jgi:serine/threonine protein kinase